MPLVSTDHEVALAAGLAVVTTHRLFRNSESANIEAVLTFPVPVHATLFDLKAEIEGRELHAKAQARSEAREIYEDAVIQGKSAVLHEELLKGIHMISVANIQPGGEIKVTTKWAMPLSVAAGYSTLRIPQSLGDVYGRTGLHDADELLTGGPAQPVLVSIHSEGQVEVVGAKLAGGCATVSSADPIDLIVSLWEPIPIIGCDAGGRSVALSLTPQTGGETALNVAVLVDHSGSMASRAGSRSSVSAHEAARNGVTALANELANGDNVDLWEFDSQFRQLGTAKTGSQDLPAAKEHLANLASQLSPPNGGTEIGAALKAVIKASSARDILLLTDGLSHQLNVEELARCGRRISVILIGADSLEARIGHLASLTGGDLFIATADDLADIMSAAIGALRRPAIALPKTTDFPDQIFCLRNNVEIHVSWTQAPIGEASSEISKGATAVAASLVINCAPPELATPYAVSEGIVSHLTSLILVDETGDIQAELPAMRKIALPATANISAMHMPSQHAHAALYDAVSPRTESRAYRAMSAIEESLPLSPPLLKPLVLREAKSVSSAPPGRPDPRQIVRLIDWGDSPESLMRGDIAHLRPEAQRFIDDLMHEDQLRRLADQNGMPLKIVAIAVLAIFASDEDRRAGRIWSALLNRLIENLADRTRREFQRPLQYFFGEIDARLNGLVDELGRSVDGDLGQAVMEVTSKGQARCMAVIHDLENESSRRLSALIEARVAEVEKEFLLAGHALKD
jgi:hypothetical protein